MSEDEANETKAKKTRKSTPRKKKTTADSKTETQVEAEKTVAEEKSPEPVKKTRARKSSAKGEPKESKTRRKKPAPPEEKIPAAPAPEPVRAVPEPKPVPEPEHHPEYRQLPPPLVQLKYGKGESSYAHIASFRKKAYREALGRTEWERLIKWRKEGTITPVEHPTRLDRARSLGYKAKQGITLVRVRVRRGGLRKRKISKGRRARRKGILKITMNKSIQRIAEERVQKHYPNMEVLNSYHVGQDGMHKWYEVILVDPYHPSVLSDKNLSWISDPAHSNRVYRGLTSSGRRGRGMRWKGKGAEKVRPSIRAHDRKGK